MFMTACDNCYFGGKTVGYRGDPASPIVIIGESPGVIEVYKQMPFVGESGKVLNDALKKAGYDSLPYEPYFINAINCLPRKKNYENLSAAITRCRGRLLEDIRRHPRKLILCLGNGAAWTATGNFDIKITQERGKLFESDLAEYGILVTVHPAFLLRGGGNYLQFQNDINYSFQLLVDGMDAFRLPDGTKYKVIETEEEARIIGQELLDLNKDDIIAADIEGTGFSHISDKILCVGFQYKAKESIIVPAHLLRRHMFQSKAQYVWHNGKFDIKFLNTQLKAKARVDHDTLLMNYDLNEKGGIHNLDQVASDWLGSPNHKNMLDPWTKQFYIETRADGSTYKRRGNYGDVPKDVLYRYLALDLADTFNLYHLLWDMICSREAEYKAYTKTYIPASNYLAKVEQNGLDVDEKYIAANAKRLKHQIKLYDYLIQRIARVVNPEDWGFGKGKVINPRSSQQISKLLYEKLKLGTPGQSTDKKAIEKLERTNPHRVLTYISKQRKVQKAYSTYVKNVLDNIDVDHRVHTTFNIHGTGTGRLSSSDPNLQNIPRDPLIRGQFIPREGYGYLEVDLSQAELRSLAELSGCTALSAIYLNDDMSLHDELSIFLFGDDFTKEDKMKAKTVNFGIPYGREAPSIAEAFNVSVEEAQKWLNGWANRFPGAWEYIQKCRAAPGKGQTITTCFGRKKRPGVVSLDRLRNLQNEYANFPHQSIASDITLHSGIQLIDILAEKYKAYIVNTVHDCLVIEVPLDWIIIKEVAQLTMDTMESIPPKWGLTKIPFKAEAEFGHRWGSFVEIHEIESKYKGDILAIPDFIAPH